MKHTMYPPFAAEDTAIKKRLRREIKNGLILLACGLGYLIWYRVTQLGIPCIFYEKTGLLCPACGITRAFVCLSQLKWGEAYRHNALVFFALPPLLVLEACREYRYIKTGDRNSKKRGIRLLEAVVYAILLVAAVAYGIYRNFFMGETI